MVRSFLVMYMIGFLVATFCMVFGKKNTVFAKCGHKTKRGYVHRKFSNASWMANDGDIEACNKCKKLSSIVCPLCGQTIEIGDRVISYEILDSNLTLPHSIEVHTDKKGRFFACHCGRKTARKGKLKIGWEYILHLWGELESLPYILE